MTYRDPRSWVWAEALELLRNTERLQRLVTPLIERTGGSILKSEADNVFAVYPDAQTAVESAHQTTEKLKQQVVELKQRIDEGERTATTLVARKNAAMSRYIDRLRRETQVRYEPGYAPGP